MDASPTAPPEHAFPNAKLRPARSLRFAYGLVAFWGAIVTAVVIGMPELRALMGGLGSLMCLMMGVGIGRLRSQSPRGGNQLEAHVDGLHVEGKLAIPRNTMIRADVSDDTRGATVSIQRINGMAAVIDVGSIEEGQVLVKALGLDAESALSTFDFDSPLAARVPRWGHYLYMAIVITAPTLPLLFLPASHVVAWLGVALALNLYLPLLASALPARLSVGLDGLLFRWAWRRNLIRFEDLRSVEHDGERVHLTLADGRRQSLSASWTGSRFGKTGSGDAGFSSRAAYLDAVVGRVREALTASRGRIGHAEPSALLRQGRALDAWVGALRATLARGAKGFRDAEMLPERLWMTVEDGGADPTARAAAAVALASSLDDADRERLRGVARVVVSPRLRVAIEAAAGGGDDAAVEEALAALEGEREQDRHARR
jgi:hypothetical protein